MTTGTTGNQFPSPCSQVVLGNALGREAVLRRAPTVATDQSQGAGRAIARSCPRMSNACPKTNNASVRDSRSRILRRFWVQEILRQRGRVSGASAYIPRRAAVPASAVTRVIARQFRSADFLIGVRFGAVHALITIRRYNRFVGPNWNSLQFWR